MLSPKKDVKGPEISGEAGSLGTYKGRISYGHQFKNNFEMLLSGSYYDSKGEERLYYKEFDISATHYGVAENADSDRSYSFFSKFSFHGFSLEGAHISREKVVPTASFGTVFNDPRNRTIDEYSFLNLKYEYNSEGHLEFMGRLYYGRYHYQGDYIFDYAASGNPADYTLLKDLSWGDWWGTEVQVSTLFLEKYKVIIGGEYRDNFRQDQETYDETPYFKYLDDRRNSKIWAFYMQAEIPLFSTLRLNAGLRYDHYETFGGTTNPRVALIYNPLQNTFIKFLYGSAFRAPNVFELYYQDGGASTKSNPNLKPEKINTYEVVLEQYIGKYFKFSTAGYYYKIEDLISQEIDPEDGLMIYRNLEQIEAKGLEFELEGKWPNLLEGRISYSYQENENKQTGSILTNSPRHMVKLNLTVPLIQRKLFAGLESQYMSIRKTLAGNEAESFFVTNLTLFSKNLVKGLEASASVYNIFDHKYRDPGSSEHLQDLLQQDGRAFRFKLTYKF
jgi:outer membrane receptor for ferrienterochelin and colicins